MKLNQRMKLKKYLNKKKKMKMINKMLKNLMMSTKEMKNTLKIQMNDQSRQGFIKSQVEL